MIAVLVSERSVYTVLVVLCPAKFTVELWIENKNMAGTFNDFLQAGASALEMLTKAQLHSIRLLIDTSGWGHAWSPRVNLGCLLSIEGPGLIN